jgi:hypothetical protein
MFDLLIFVLPLAIVFIAVLLGVTILVPSWHWVAGLVLVVAGFLAWAWIDHSLATAAPGSKEGQAEGLFVVGFTISTYAFCIAAVIYAAGLVWWKSRA